MCLFIIELEKIKFKFGLGGLKFVLDYLTLRVKN
jgi:hypothetical protein